MADLVDVVARLRALQHGQAVAITRQRQLVIQPHARIVTLLAMAGEDTSVHAVAIGRFGAPPEIAITPDPRSRDDEYDLLRWLLPHFETYYAECLAANTFPQIWVSSGGALGHLDTLADRLRFTDDAEVQRIGTLWTYAGERSPIAGQQALISATAALRAHYMTGQQESEDEHLGALLTWIEPPPGRDILAAVATAEAQPMGVKTDPQFDSIELQPAVAGYNRARNAGEPDNVLAFHRSQIQRKLESVIRPIYAATQRAIALLSEPRWQLNPALAVLAEQEAAEFAQFMAARQEGHYLPYRDQPKAGAFKIVAREKAVSNVEAGTLRHDRSARERGVASGAVLRATLTDNQRIKLAPRVFEIRLVLSSQQDRLHLRAGDELWSLDDPKMAVRIIAVERRGPCTWITATVSNGKRVGRDLQTGTRLDFGPSAPNWQSLGLEMRQMKIRLEREPWTHGQQILDANASGRTMPDDLLAAVERLT